MTRFLMAHRTIRLFMLVHTGRYRREDKLKYTQYTN